MDFAVDLIEKLTLLVPVLLAVGAAWKYLPVVRNWTNSVIPLLNALVGFLVAFAAPAKASIFGDLGHALSVPAQIFLSLTAAAVAGVIHDKYLEPLGKAIKFPKSPGTK